MQADEGLSPRLDPPTYFVTEFPAGSPFAFSSKTYVYPSGHAETSMVKVPADMMRGKRRTTKKKRIDMSLENRRRCANRARTAIRRVIMNADLDRLLTLTYRENITNTKKAWHDFTKFIRLVRKHYPNFVYVAVPEFQKRGAVHFHLSIRGLA